ncbi:type IV toxin-antitoxin system AbiEi family antitoxin [Collimonas pratensis]|uniref:Uncharacterized protein n=1 Tax=Collimonas pratensis TaxID=279113 RepID=A0A127QCE7_9BURK|nr:type IV toxin-antitoxin system AbiEi family antitoxin [Collimonas pratensis]AMP07707.1 hypothetical protein CPter91_5424 [Collimonas pratensis]
MNDDQFLVPSSPEAELITHALDALRESTGITGQLLHPAPHADAEVTLQVAGQSLLYACEVKRKIDRFLALDSLKARFSANQTPALLICESLSHEMAARCRELGVQFIDTAGNAYLTNTQGVLIHVAGRKAKKESLGLAGEMTITPASLRMIFAFLADPSMLNATYRDISVSVQISTGAIGKIFETLEARGFISTAPGGNRIISSPAHLLSEWTSGYLGRLRPKLKKFRFTAPDPSALYPGWNPTPHSSAWGGEVAADILTKHLKPATFTIYMDMEAKKAELTALIKQFRLQADPHGPIEVLQPFWNMEYFNQPDPTVVPRHLVYADLLGTQDPRNLDLAKQISSDIIKHVHNAAR